MRTLALRPGARIAVSAEEWHHAFCVVTRGRVRLERRDGEPGPVLGHDAAFWLRGTGVRALRNPYRRTAEVRVITPPGSRALPNDERNDMNSMNATAVVTDPGAARTSRPHRFRPHRLRRLVGTGLAAALAASAATTLAAALAQAAGADFEVHGGQTIPLGGFAVVTGFFSAVGIVIAAVLLRLSARPAERFVWTAMSLTAVSLIPPLLVGATTATTAALLGLHLLPAAVMIPILTRSLGTRAG